MFMPPTAQAGEVTLPCSGEVVRALLCLGSLSAASPWIVSVHEAQVLLARNLYAPFRKHCYGLFPDIRALKVEAGQGQIGCDQILSQAGFNQRLHKRLA